MPSKFYVFRDGQLIEKGAAPPPGARIHVITDAIAPTYNPLDGKMTDSKSHLRNMGRALGLDEVGTEKFRDRPEQDDGPRIREHLIREMESQWK